MTNFEYYAVQIKLLDYDFGFKKDGEFAYCGSIKCNKCEFYGGPSCTKAKIEWLYQEYQEYKAPELTNNEHMLCEVMNYKYLARNKSGQLVAFKDKPVKGEVAWDSQTYVILITDRRFKDCKFSFIKWEDEEPWAISDLLKLEVME